MIVFFSLTIFISQNTMEIALLSNLNLFINYIIVLSQKFSFAQ